jgi:diguanylate cyclase (GGDEF)-like protein
MITAQWLAFAALMALLLASVAAVSYILGRRYQAKRSGDNTGSTTSGVTGRDLGDISQGMRRRLATHHASILQFRERISELSSGMDGPVWKLLAEEAERVLKPTEELSDEIAQAYNEIREQTSNLPPPGNDRLDILTGLDSREAIEGTIIFLLALKARYDNLFSLVLVEFDHFDAFNIQHGGRAEGDRVLRELADIIKESTRDTDAAGRYNGQEFVVVLPETGLEGACVFGERLRQKVEQRLPISISCGLATVADGDTAQTILSRADSALYSAVSAGNNRVFQHTGRSINLVTSQVTVQDAATPELEPTTPTLESIIDDENVAVTN